MRPSQESSGVIHRQEPTCSNTFIHTAQDAHRIFYAVLLGKLPMITRHLNTQERDALSAGHCYVWEEQEPQSVTASNLGIGRFTEGRQWSASRLRDDFLFYYEKFKGVTEDQRPPCDWDPLVKQTYSVFVNLSPSPGQPEPVPPKKWHMTAYYTDGVIDSLHTVDDLLATKDLCVPEGVFRCSRSVKPRSRTCPASRTPRTAPSKATTGTKTTTLASSLPASSSPTAAGPSRSPKRKRSVPARTQSSKKVKEEPAPSLTPASPSPTSSASVSPAASLESALTDLPSRSSSVELQDHVRQQLKFETDLIVLAERGTNISPMHGSSGKQGASRSSMSTRPSPQKARASRRANNFSSSRSPQTARVSMQELGLGVFAPFPSDVPLPPNLKTYTQPHTNIQSQLLPKAHAQAPHGAPLAAARPDSPLHAHDIGANLYPRSSQIQAHTPQLFSMQLFASPIYPSPIQPQLIHVRNQFTTAPTVQISFQEYFPVHDSFPMVNSQLAPAIYGTSQAFYDQPLFTAEAPHQMTLEHVVSSYDATMRRITLATSFFESAMAPPPTSAGQGTSALQDYPNGYGLPYDAAFQSTSSGTATDVDGLHSYVNSPNSLAIAFSRPSGPGVVPSTSAFATLTPSSARSPALNVTHPLTTSSWSGSDRVKQRFRGVAPNALRLPFAGMQTEMQGYEVNNRGVYSAVQTQEPTGIEFVDAQMQDYGQRQAPALQGSLSRADTQSSPFISAFDLGDAPPDPLVYLAPSPANNSTHSELSHALDEPSPPPPSPRMEAPGFESEGPSKPLYSVHPADLDEPPMAFLRPDSPSGVSPSVCSPF